MHQICLKVTSMVVLGNFLDKVILAIVHQGLQCSDIAIWALKEHLACKITERWRVALTGALHDLQLSCHHYHSPTFIISYCSKIQDGVTFWYWLFNQFVLKTGH